ncbi:hypothetical protein F5Y15DRAFT_232918 [Xylariaceae sp. FL0016]|nr:hypothetical protein F5Y15DRAFT_232918 [Xylariaceae sp. FL0016]
MEGKIWDCIGQQSAPVPKIGDVVIIIVIITSGLTVISLLFQYLFSYDALHDGNATRPPNPVDLVVLTRFRRLLGMSSGLTEEGPLQSALEQSIQSLADAHLGVAIALLAYGCAALPRGSSVGHWWQLLGLAWFAVITNLAAHTFLRSHYRLYPAKRPWRLVLLVCLICALAFGMIPTARVKHALAGQVDGEAIGALLDSPALCYFPGHASPLDLQFQLETVALPGLWIVGALAVCALASVVLRVCRVSGTTSAMAAQDEPSTVGNGVQCVRCEQRVRLLVLKPLLACWMTLRVYADVFTSVVAQVLGLSALMAWVSLRFFEVRQLAPNPVGGEWEWSLEQIFAVVIVAAPLKHLAGYVCYVLMIRVQHPAAGPSVQISLVFARAYRGLLANWRHRQGYEQLTDGDQESRNGASLSDVPSPEGNDDSYRQRERQRTIRRAYKQSGYAVVYQYYFVRRWLSPAIPIFTIALHLVLLLAVPQTTRLDPAAAVRRTAAWAVLYSPLLLYAYILASMIVEERIRSASRRKSYYRLLIAAALGLSAGAVLDTLFGLGGTPLSYLAMAALGLIGVAYLLYGLVAQPGLSWAAKGKWRASEDVEGQRGAKAQEEEEEELEGEERKQTQVPVHVRVPARKGKGRVTSIDKTKRMGVRSQRLLQKAKPSYGTMDSAQQRD